MTNLRAFIPILISILIALGGSYFLYDWVKKRAVPEKEIVIKESNAVPVVVATAPIQWGIRITPEMVTTVPYLENSLPKGYYSKVDDILNRVVTSSLIEGDAVLEHRLAPTTMETGGISAILEPGKRAISVKGNNVLGIAGFINPGNRVDVLVTIEDPEKEQSITKIVLEDLSVLASGRQIQENEKGEPSPVDVYTLEVTPEQGERLTLAANRGSLQFALRGAMDLETVLTKGVTVPELLTSLVLNEPKPVAVQPVVQPAAATNRPAQKTTTKRYAPPRKKTKVTVEMIKGVEQSKKEFTL